MKQTEKKQEVPTNGVENSPKTDLTSEGHVCRPPENRVEIPYPGGNSHGMNRKISDAAEIIEGISKDVRRHFSEDGIIRTTVLIGDARMDRWTQAGEYTGYLKGDRIIFKEEGGKRTFTTARGNVEFCRNNIRITSDFARQNHRTGVIVFKGKKGKEVTIIDKEGNTVCTPLFIYNQITHKQIAKGEVKFRIYLDSSDAAGENAANETDTPSDAPENTENQAEKEINAEPDNIDENAVETPDADAGNFEKANPEDE